ncbi:MAG: IclR family transcriptional regulator, partial [Rhodocyclaceae bacterium]
MDTKPSSIDKTLSILELVAQHAKGMSLAELVKGVDIPKTTAHRILDVLTQRGYVEWHRDSERYSLGLKALELGISGLVGLDIVDVAIPYLQDLSAQTGETSFLCVYNNGDVVYLYKAEGTRSIQTTARLGSRRPAYCTALGKAILAHLPIEETDRIFEKKLMKFTDKTVIDRVRLYEEFALVRSNGYAVDDEGIEVELTCMAVPVHNYTGMVIGAISISGPTPRLRDDWDNNVAALTEAGKLISKRLGYVRRMNTRLPPA